MTDAELLQRFREVQASLKNVAADLEIHKAQLAPTQTTVRNMAETVWRHEIQLQPTRGNAPLTKSQADLLYHPSVMKLQLSSGGVAPLALDGLKGSAGEIQPANIPEVAALPEIGDTTVKVGTVVHFSGTSYRRSAAGWQALGGGGVSTAASVAGGGGSGGTATLAWCYSTSVNGTLAIGSDLAPRAYFLTSFVPALIRADVKTAPVGASLVVAVYYTTSGGPGTLIGTLTVAAGAFFATTTSAVGVPLGTYLRVDITAVGTTLPGADMTVTMG